MELQLTRPIVFFDIEATGLNITKDAIVELSFVKIFPDNHKEVKTWRVRPWDWTTNTQIHISEEASAVNGIKDEDVAGEPTLMDLAPEILSWLEDSDLGGYNSVKFDLPMLAEEFERLNKHLRDENKALRDRQKCGIDLDKKPTPYFPINFREKRMVDVQVIYHQMEPRNLKAAYRFYCDKDLENAHTAEADTEATYEVLKSQLDRYEGTIKNDIEQLSNMTTNKHIVDYAGRLVRNDAGEVIVNFGKHKGKLLRDVYHNDKSYFAWVYNGDFALDTKQQFFALEKQFKEELSSEPLKGEDLSKSVENLQKLFQ